MSLDTNLFILFLKFTTVVGDYFLARRKKTMRFYNNSGKLENVILFLEQVQKKITYININCTVDGRDIEVSLSGPQDLQYLATERLKKLADEHLE